MAACAASGTNGLCPPPARETPRRTGAPGGMEGPPPATTHFRRMRVYGSLAPAPRPASPLPSGRLPRRKGDSHHQAEPRPRPPRAPGTPSWHVSVEPVSRDGRRLRFQLLVGFPQKTGTFPEDTSLGALGGGNDARAHGEQGALAGTPSLRPPALRLSFGTQQGRDVAFPPWLWVPGQGWRGRGLKAAWERMWSTGAGAPGPASG